MGWRIREWWRGWRGRGWVGRMRDLSLVRGEWVGVYYSSPVGIKEEAEVG